MPNIYTKTATEKTGYSAKYPIMNSAFDIIKSTFNKIWFLCKSTEINYTFVIDFKSRKTTWFY